MLIAAKRGQRPYVALWCEHHEDFLAERTDSRYDAYQVKTSRPELGAWTLRDPEMVRAIGRFVDLVMMFDRWIANVYFVSNTEYDTVTSQSSDDKRRSRCPKLFLEHVQACAHCDSIEEPFATTFLELQAECGCAADSLFTTLQRMNLIIGPSRRDFDAVLAHEHLGSLDEYRGLPPDRLDKFRDDLVSLVHRASSLQVTDPIRHLVPLINDSEVDPTLTAKRLVVTETIVYPAGADSPPPFQFLGTPTLNLGKARHKPILIQKLEKGGLADEIDYLMERERAAEFNLIEDATRRPHIYPALLRQIEQTVLGECREAHLRARQSPEPYGPQMMIEVQDRLRHLAEHRPSFVGNHSYECLIGVASLLTSECRVWWGPRFPIDHEQHA